MLADDLGRMLLARHDPRLLANELWLNNPYAEREALTRAARCVGPDVDPLDWLTHRLWCASRQALAGAAPSLSVSVDHPEYAAETVGHPTIVVAPMTLALQDAVPCLGAVFGDRPRIIFGEGVTQDDVPEVESVAGDGNGALRRIVATLDTGGVYCTYGDFVYSERHALNTLLFGVKRPISRGWVHLAARHDAMLLPMVCCRTDTNRIHVRVAEPILVQLECRRVDLSAVGNAMTLLLENRIRLAASQWLLLPSLTFETPQVAKI